MRKTVTLAWGLNGMAHVSRTTSLCVIVDVLSFSTAVVAGCSRGAEIFPYRWNDERAKSFALAKRADLAVQRQDIQRSSRKIPSLSPRSLTGLNQGDRLVLPSPNGSTLSYNSVAATTIAGSLRNASAVAHFVNRVDEPVAIIAAGERWPDGSLRVALEDLLGAASIITKLDGDKDVEALAAEAIFKEFRDRLTDTLLLTASGQELVDRGFRDDVAFASDLDSDNVVPVLIDGCYKQE